MSNTLLFSCSGFDLQYHLLTLMNGAIVSTLLPFFKTKLIQGFSQSTQSIPWAPTYREAVMALRRPPDFWTAGKTYLKMPSIKSYDNSNRKEQFFLMAWCRSMRDRETMGPACKVPVVTSKAGEKRHIGHSFSTREIVISWHKGTSIGSAYLIYQLAWLICMT